jgi:hypothetical protein
MSDREYTREDGKPKQFFETSCEAYAQVQKHAVCAKCQSKGPFGYYPEHGGFYTGHGGGHVQSVRLERNSLDRAVRWAPKAYDFGQKVRKGFTGTARRFRRPAVA